MVADLSGSTPLGERLDPEELRGILGGFFRGLSHEVQRFGGTIDKYIGDAVRATFDDGAPDVGANQALDAGLAMLGAIAHDNEDLERRFNVRLSLRIGVNTGEIVAASEAGRAQLSVGRTVTLAQRLESTAIPNTVQASENTYRLARGAFRFEVAPQIVLADTSEVVRAYRLVGRRRRAAAPGQPLIATESHLRAAAASASLQVGEEKPDLLEEQRKVVSVLFADLAGSLSAQLEPERLQTVLGVYFGAVAAQIQHFGGTIDKFIGDAVMAVFGAPMSHEDDAARAVHAALGIQAAIRKENESLERQHGVRLAVRVGVNTGEVIAGLLPGEILAYTVTGDVVNTAQRIEAATPANDVLVSEATAELARKSFQFEPVPPLSLKGKAHPVPAYRVIGTQLEAAMPRAAALLGRETELARLSSLFADAAAAQGRLVHIYGEAGVGKSRLVEEFRWGLPPDVGQLSARCSSYESRQGYGLVADVIRQAFGIQKAAQEDEARRAIVTGLAPLALAFESSAVALFLEVLGYDVRSTLDPEGKRRQLTEILRRLLEHRSALGPFTFSLEDLHWSDEASASVMADVLSDVPRLRCLVLSTSRDASPGPWETQAMRLMPLDPESAIALVERVATDALTPEMRSAIVERTGGNPFFIEEVVRAFASGHATTVPATVQELLEARVDALDATPKHVAQRAAVIGRTFWMRVLAEVSPGDPVPHAVAFLETQGFVAPFEVTPEEKYAFRHALVQEVFYQTQLLSQRRKIHGEIGSAIEHLFSERVDEFTDILAFHFDHSEDDERAIAWLERAGARARGLFANAEAIAHFLRASERARKNPRLAHRLPFVLLDLADVRVLVGELDDALRLYTEARDLGNDVRAWRGIARTQRDRGNYAEALKVIDAALDALGPAGTDVLPLKLEQAQTLSVQGRFIDAIAVARASLSEAGDRRDPIVAQLLVRLARSEAVAGEGEAALGDANEARTISAQYGDVVGELAAVRLIGDSYTRLGRLDEGVAAFREALRLAERIGAVAEAAGGLLNLGWAERRRGRLDEAIAWDRRAAEQFDRIRHGSGRATAYGNLASHLVLRGNYDEALEQAERALEIARAIDHTYTIADVFQTIASARMGRGEFTEAAARAEEAAELFVRMGARPQSAEALRLAAEAWAKAGNEERARDLESRARSVLSP